MRLFPGSSDLPRASSNQCQAYRVVCSTLGIRQPHCPSRGAVLAGAVRRPVLEKLRQGPLPLNDLSPPSHHENRRESGRSRRRTRSTRLSARCRPALGRHHDGRPYPFSPAAPEPVARAIVPTDVEDPPRKRDRPLPISLSVHPSAKRGPRRPGAAPSPRPRPSRRAATTAPICSSSSTWPSSRPTRRRAGASSPPSRCGPPRPPSRRP